MKINRQQVLAAMRMGKSVPDSALERRLDAVGAEILAAARRIGLTLTDSLQMIPAKSVSAIIGIG